MYLFQPAGESFSQWAIAQICRVEMWSERWRTAWHCRSERNRPGPARSGLCSAQLAWHTFPSDRLLPPGCWTQRINPTNLAFIPPQGREKQKSTFLHICALHIGNVSRAVDGGMAGFVPQKEIVYNGLLPYSDRLDREATELLTEIKANLSRAVLLRELWPGAAFWARKLFS